MELMTGGVKNGDPASDFHLDDAPVVRDLEDMGRFVEKNDLVMTNSLP